MAKQDKPTKAICWHGGWQVLKILELKDNRWLLGAFLFEEAAKRLPEHIAAKVTKDSHDKIIKDWFWRTVGPKGLGFVERDDNKGKKRGYRLTPKGLKFVKRHTWDEYEAHILEANQDRASIYYLEHLSDAGVRRVIDLAINELIHRAGNNNVALKGVSL